jgi:uncharacterized repeat protein (TIGR01451 family)
MMSFASSPDFALNGAAYTATIASLAAGASATLEITLMVNAGAYGTITNNVEITDATNAEGLVDEDGDLATIDGSSDDTSEVATDDDIDDEAPGTAGTEDNGDDADDYDPAQIMLGPVFDLALTKVLTSTGPFVPGDDVTFTVTVVNQGAQDATDIDVVDYLPTNMTFVSSPDFSATAPHTATIASLAVGATATLEITASINAGTIGTLTNNAEIVSADNDGDANTPAPVDQDSAINGNT